MKTMNKIQRLSVTMMMMLMATATWAYTVTISNAGGNPVITAKVDGNDITSTTDVVAGKTVILTVAENDSKYLTKLNIQSDVPASGASAPRRTNSITIQGDVEVRQTGEFTYEFTMPIGNVTITPTFSTRTSIASATVTLRDAANTSTTTTSETMTWQFDWLPHLPEVYQVVVSSTTLTAGTDYTVSSFSSITNVEASPRTITITGKGKYNGTKTVSYNITPRDISGASVQFTPTSFVYNHQTQAPAANTVEVYLQGQHLVLNTDYNNVTIPSPSENANTYTISVTGIGNFTGTASNTYTITKMPISDCTFTGSTSFVYNGSTQKPSLVVSDGVGNLTENTHYTISYSNSSSTDIGSYTMTFTANDGTNYSGSKEITYTISSAGPKIYSVGGTVYTGTTTYSTIYTGAEIEPAVVVKDGSGEAATTLVKDTHYKVIYSNNKNVGTAKISVVGIGLYNFVAETTFEITPKSVSGLTIELSQSSFTYNASTQKPNVTVKDGTTTLIENKDYTLVNAGGVNVGTYHATITGVGNYMNSLTSGNYSITALSFSNSNTTITLSNTSYVYNGDEKRPEVVRVVIGGNVIPSADYQLVYSNNTNVGTATVRITKSTTSNNLAESTATTNFATQSFTIEKKSIANVEITLDPSSFTFKNGVTQKPTTVTVVDKERGASGVTLTSGTDYTLTNEGGIAAGVYDVIVTGAGNYIGSAKKSYVINETAGSTAITIADIADQTYTGSAITPTPTITYTYGENQTVTLQNNTHYTLSYINNTNVGEATVIVTLKGGYSGSATKTFNIVAKSLAGATVTPNTSFTYNGNVQKPSFVAVVDSRTLDAGVDYNVTYNGDAISAGTQNVTINGIGNYTGTQAGSYTINKLSLSTATIKLPSEMYVYNRSDQKPTPVVSVGSLVLSTNDYDVSWDDDNNTTTTSPNFENVGTKYITVTGQNNCQDSKGITYAITAKQIDANMVTLAHTEMTYTGSALDPGVTVKDGETPLIQGTDAAPQEYKLEITNNVNVGTATIKVTGQGNYTGVVQKTFNIQKQAQQDFTISDIAAVVYNGSEYRPTPTVQYGSVNLTNEKDYTLSYRNNVNAGTATVIVTGKGGYEGSSGTKDFTINPKQLVPAKVSLSSSYVSYTGLEQKPAVTVLDGDNPLSENRDYTIVYSNNINAGTATVTVTGCGNYSTSDQTAGTIEKQFTINKLDITTATITLFSLSSYVYDGTNKEPGVQLVKVGDVVVPSSAYSVVYSNNMNASTSTTKARATVTANETSNFIGSAYTEFSIEQKEVNSSMITFSGEGFNTVSNSFTYDGASHSPTVTVANGTLAMTPTTDYTLTNPAHTEVGNYVVQIDGVGNYKGTATKQYSIVTAGSTAFTVEAIPAQTYTGLALMPEPVVKAMVNNVLTTLTKGTHYTVAWANNVNVGTNTASVTVTGLDNYAGTQTVYFTINPKELIADETTLSATVFSYNGTEQKPTVTVKDGTTTLVKDKDYTLAYPDDMINQGTKTITITGIGNYASQFTKTYAINQLSLSTATITLATLPSYVYDGTAKTPAVQLVKVGELVVPATAYDVAYTSNTNVGTATVTVTAKTGSNFKDGNSTTFNIEKKEVNSNMITLSGSGFDATTTSFTFDGSAHIPTVTVADGALAMVLDTDYALTNPGGTAVGNYTVTITGKGNYKGSASKQYSIVTAGSTGFTVDAISAQDYTGLPLTPTVVVKKAGTTDVLTENTDYTLAWTNNINAGANTASVTVTGKGNYSGTQTVYFTITPKSLTDGTITATLSPTSFDYTGSTQKPTVTVKDGTAKTLVLNTDYTLVNDGGTAQGSYTVTITGIGNYKDVLTPTYTIGNQSLTGAVVVLNQLDSYVYDGNPKTPGVSEVKLGSVVIPASNYDVTYSGNVNAGTATVTVTGKGNCSGSATATFTITPKVVNSDMITISPTTFNYDGALHKPTTVTVKDGTKVMVEGTTTEPKDYLLTNEGGTAVGTYSVTITGQGNYTGTASKSYSIVANDASGFTIDAIADQTYDGTAKEPAPVVKDGTTTLASDYYTCAYLNNVNAGTAVVTVTGKNGYTFVKSQTFTIKPKTLTEAMVSLSATDFTYNGNVQKATVTVTDNNASSVSIITSNDYIVTNEGGSNVGTYHVVVNGQNNYTGSVDKTFTISQLSLSTATITLSTLSSYVYEGSAKTPAVQLVKVGELVVPATSYDVAYSSNTNVGTATVTVTAKAGTNFKDGNSTTFNIEKKEVNSNMITLSGSGFDATTTSFTFDGSAHIPTVTVADGALAMVLDTDYALTNPGGTAVGNYTVTITGKGNYKGSASKQYSIVTAGSTGFTVDAISAQDYTGLPLTPTVVVKKAGTTDVLTENTDYTLAWTNNINAGANTASVTVTGKGNYSGTQTVYFTITPKSLTDGTITATLSPTSFDYTGSTQKPTVTVKDGTAKTLVLNTDYTLVNDGGTAQGSYTVTITGIGNYKDVLTPTYTIGNQSLTGAVVVLNQLDSYVYDGNPKTPGVSEVKLGSVVIPASNYDVTYSGNVNAGTATVTVTGKGNCSGSATATFTITPKVVNSDMITISPTTFNYDGALHKPTTVTVKDGTKVMVEGTTTEPKDYLLTNEGGTAVGTYSVTITGQGNYTGTASKSYSIVANDASGFTIDAIADQTYDGTAKEPAPVVKDGTTTLASDYYTCAYLNNVNAGTAVVTVTGKNGYTFVKSQTFTIKPKTLTEAMVSLSATDFTYNGNVQKATVTVTDNNASSVSIITSNDYIVTNEGGSNVGTYHVVVNGQNNYTGSVDKTFTISQLSLSTATITLSTLSSYVYEGSAKTPAVQLVKVGELVVPATSYDVAYSSNTNVGTATVTVTAKAGTNFKDGNSTTFNIESKDVTSDMIYLSSENLEYTGDVQAPTVTVKDGTKVLTLTTDYTLSNPGGTAVGTYEVTITGQGNYKGSAKKQYSIITEGATGFTVEAITNQTYTGSPLTPAVTVKKAGTETVLEEGTDYTVGYSNNTNVGTATVTVTGNGNYSGTHTMTFAITAKSLADGMVVLSATSFTYNGAEQRPSVVVTDTDTEMPLMQNVDYVVLYPADMISQGLKTITVRGVGNYTSEVTKQYSIGLLSLNDASVTLNELTNYIYDGTEKKPTVREVTIGAMVVPTTGYTVDYPDDLINQGVKTLTIKGTGNYTGSTTKTYTVTPKMVSNDMLLFDNVNLIHTGSVIKPVVTVKDGNRELKEDTDYVLVNDGATEVGTYYVYITGKGNYTGNASRSYNIITRGASVFGVSNIGSVEYNGKDQEPAVTVIDNSTVEEIVLTKGLHYTVSYSNNKNAGTATVIVTGIGGYAGTVTRNFTITPKPLKSSMVTLAPVTDTTTGTVHFTYNGLAQQPTVSVSDVPEGETTSILMDNDYALSNPGAINAGMHPVTVTGRGNYSGTVTVNYYIDAQSIEGAAITLYQQASNVYTGKEQKPGVREVVVGSGASTLAVPTSGYSITGYANNINVGTATVTITGQGNFTGTASTTFDIAKKPLTADMVTLDSETFTYTGDVLKPVVTVSDGEGDDNIIKASDYTVSNDGGKEVGEYKVTVNATADGNYSGAVTRTFSIVSKGTATFDVALSTTSVVYDGIAKTPGVTVTDGGVLLTVNDDYTVSYTDNVNVGTATVTVTGKGNYAGTKTGTFEITPRPLTGEMVTLSATSFVYNGGVQKPEVTVSDGTILTTGDYSVTNNGGTHVGTFHVVVDGKGNYTGQVDKTFDIGQLSLSDANVVLNELQSYTYDGKAKKPSVREVMAGGIMVPTTGYTVSYGENVNVGTGTVTITGQGDFKDTKTVTFDIVQKAVEDQMITLSNYEYIYTGSLLKPEVTVRDGEMTLTLDKDYTLKNDGGTSVGTYEVTVTGQGNYKGTARKTFVINTKEAGVFVVTLDAESVTYSGSEQQPAVTVKDGETVLTAGTHYTVAYQNNVNVGTATVVVTGQGQYEGQKSKTFLITPKTLNDEMVTLSEEYFIYNAMLQRPVVTVNDGSALTVNDYMVSNEGGQDVGTYSVTVTGRNNYTGTVTKNYSIYELSLEGAQVVLYQLPNYIYDGQEKAPSVREVLIGNIVVPSNCYTTTMTANVNVGRVVVTVTGQGNYTGSASTTFDIKAKPVTTAMMTLTPEVFYYNGMNQKPAVEVQDGDLAMKAGTDYTLTNAGGVEAGLYDVILKGMGNYTGEAVKKFTILISGVNTFTVILEESSVVYNGQEQRPAVTVKKDEQVLSEGRDYTVAYANNKDVGTATVVVTGLGDYEGSQMKTFVITPKALTDEMVTLDKTTFTYTGSKLQPVVTVSDGDIMTENDYVVTNEGGTEVGEYEVKVDGQNNYMGTVTKTYTIVKSDINVDVPTTGGGDDPNVEDVTLTLTSTGENGDNAVVTGVVIPEADQSKDLGITIPATVTVNGQTYNVTGLGSGCFAGVDNLTDIYLPDTEEPLTIGENAIPISTKVHTPLALLDDYALMPTLEENFKDGKVMTTVTAKNRYWTFSCGVDVCVPDGVTVYTVHERSNTSVALVQLTEYDLMVGGQPLVKANNGVLIAGSANTDYNLVASAKRMTSGTPIGTYDSKDYGPQNLLIPVIVPTHFESGEYYVMKDNQFRSIRQDGEEVKVPACKAVLYLKSSQQAPQLTLDIVLDEEIVADDDAWFDIEGRKLEGRPTTKGVFIHNKQKIVIK